MPRSGSLQPANVKQTNVRLASNVKQTNKYTHIYIYMVKCTFGSKPPKDTHKAVKELSLCLHIVAPYISEL